MKNLKSNKNNNDPVAEVIVVELVGSFQPKKLIFFFKVYLLFGVSSTYCEAKAFYGIEKRSILRKLSNLKIHIYGNPSLISSFRLIL